MTVPRHSFLPSWPGAASDGRDKPGHDGVRAAGRVNRIGVWYYNSPSRQPASLATHEATFEEIPEMATITTKGRAAVLAAKLVVYKGAPHGMCTTLQDKVNDELLACTKA
jgi:hypothetical protein